MSYLCTRKRHTSVAKISKLSEPHKLKLKNILL